MSMDRCTDCSQVVDTDSDVNFYDFDYVTAKGYGGHCESCRDSLLGNMNNAQQDAHEKRIYG